MNLFLRSLGALLLVLAAQPALAQPPPQVGFGDTAMVAEPCPPFPKAFADWLAISGDGLPSAEAVKAYEQWKAWELANDWPGLCRFQVENRQLLAGPRPRVVFMGDSITENWRRLHPGFFTQGRVARGIGGQTTAQMVARFYQDVVTLRPHVVHIMAGSNDIAGNTGPTSETAFKNNIAAMVDLARANGVAVVLASIPPTERFDWRPELKPAPQIARLNAWLADYARRRGVVFADYASVLATPAGAMRPGLSHDGTHPDKPGYDLIEPLAIAAIAAAERAP